MKTLLQAWPVHGQRAGKSNKYTWTTHVESVSGTFADAGSIPAASTTKTPDSPRIWRVGGFLCHVYETQTHWATQPGEPASSSTWSV